MAARGLSLAYSVADQNFARTKSLGILNLSLQLGAVLSSRSDMRQIDVFSNSSLHEWHERLGGRSVRCFDRACATRLGRILWDQVFVYSQARKNRAEWLFLPKGFSSFCRKPPVKVAAYVHDAIGEWYSRRYPGATSSAEGWYFRRSLLATLRYATVIFTNSQFTRSELLTLGAAHGVSIPDIVVAGIGFEPAGITSQTERSRIVVLASPWPHKRTDLALQYMADWQRITGFTGRVDWVGRFPPRQSRPSDRGWEYHERLDERAYRLLLAESKALVYFSEYEGFGMPPLEAVSHGACPVYSAIPSTRETMDGAGAPFENTSFESFVAAMNKALRMEGAALADVAQSLYRRHNWSAVADRIIGALNAHS